MASEHTLFQQQFWIKKEVISEIFLIFNESLFIFKKRPYFDIVVLGSEFRLHHHTLVPTSD